MHLKIRSIFSTSTFRFCFILVFLFCIWQLTKIVTFLFDNSNQTNIYSTLPQNIDSYVINSNDKSYLTVSVYYETLCPDSRNFIHQHLVPSFNKAPDRFKIDFIPYGKAKTDQNSDGSLTFACQHGPVECHGNKIHSCAIQYIKDRTVLIKYLACMINDNYEPERIGIFCANSLNVNWNKIYSCSEGKEGEQLLKSNGDATNKLWPEVSFIPTILINGERPRQASVLKDFWGVACSYFPAESKPSAC